jgi:hypothetical protein
MSSDEDGTPQQFVVFSGDQRVGRGGLADAAAAAWRAQREAPQKPVLVFDCSSGAVTDLDLRGAEDEVRARHRSAPVAAARRGRPKLGVASREVTLLPRHWDWLACQPGGASATLRKLVDAARRSDAGATDARSRTEAAYRFMSAMAGDRPGFEDAARALFAGDWDRLARTVAAWPADIGSELSALLGAPATPD